MARWAPIASAVSSAAFRASRTDSSNEANPPSASRRGATLISMLNRPSSVWNAGSAMAASTSALRIAGSMSPSTRLSSISSPVIGRSKSKCAAVSIRANASRPRRTFSRCRLRSSRVNCVASTSAPMPSSCRTGSGRGYARSTVSAPRLIDQSAEPLRGPAAARGRPPSGPPRAPRRASSSTRTSGCGTRHDADVIAYLEAENAYTEARTSHLAGLTEAVFGEIKARTQETDLSVPTYTTHADPSTGESSAFWYYVRTLEGSEYADLLPHPGHRRTRHPARRRAGRSRASRSCWTPTSRPRVRSSSPSAPSPSPPPAGCWRTRPTPPATSGSPLKIKDLTTGDAARRRDRRHRVRGRLGRRDPPLLHPRRRGLAAVRGAAAPAGHRPRAPTRRC